MKELAFRLEKGDDLRASIEERCKDCTAIVLSGVGCVYEARLRMAKAESYYEKKDDFEIVSLTGTVSHGNAHIHMSMSNEKGKTKGGHLEYGCLINTTCEIVMGVLEEYDSVREFDENTGYDEIRFIKR